MTGESHCEGVIRFVIAVSEMFAGSGCQQESVKALMPALPWLPGPARPSRPALWPRARVVPFLSACSSPWHDCPMLPPPVARRCPLMPSTYRFPGKKIITSALTGAWSYDLCLYTFCFPYMHTFIFDSSLSSMEDAINKQLRQQKTQTIPSCCCQIRNARHDNF